VIGASLRLVIVGLTLSSSWGNGHATTYRALLRAMAKRGHDILFLERDVPWYADNRDLTDPDFCQLGFYGRISDLGHYFPAIAGADAVIVGSYVPDGIAVGRLVQQSARGVAAFYDIDTPVTLEQLDAAECAYLSCELVAGYDLYLSFTGGPLLDRIEREYGAPVARALYCSVDPEAYTPVVRPWRWDLSYLGTYSPDRQAALDRLLLEPARRAPHLRFAVAGPQYPETILWPPNVERIEHIAPGEHPEFYSSSRFTLNVTRAQMVRVGYSPSVRLFEAAASGAAIISDEWTGIETLFAPGGEILIATGIDDLLPALLDRSDARRARLAKAARRRVLAAHTADHRAAELEGYLFDAITALRRGKANRRQHPRPAEGRRQPLYARSQSAYR
jgi:spore maturation protein CgeB